MLSVGAASLAGTDITRVDLSPDEQAEKIRTVDDAIKYVESGVKKK